MESLAIGSDLKHGGRAVDASSPTGASQRPAHRHELPAWAGRRGHSSPPPIIIGPRCDAAEREADAIAPRLTGPNTGSTRQPTRHGCESGATGTYAMRCPDRIQPKSDDSTSTSSTTVPPIVYDILARPGRKLDAMSRELFEPRLGVDLSTVRVHDDQAAAASARAVGAQAWTVGNHIAFANSIHARGVNVVLAHEVVHVAQRSQRPVGRRVMRRQTATTVDSDGTTTTWPDTLIVAIPPASLRWAIGSQDYYLKRQGDFFRRAERGERPPDYYLSYGYKYAHRFRDILRPALSPDGQAWVDRCLRALQVAIEDRRDASPWRFAELEGNNDVFRAFAYDTHAQAYLVSGVCELGIVDELKILSTPDLSDIFTRGGSAQVKEALGLCVGRWWSRSPRPGSGPRPCATRWRTPTPPT